MLKNTALVMVLLIYVIHASLASGQSKPAFWTGQLKVFQFAFSNDVQLDHETYSLSGNDKGVVRRELTMMNMNPISELGRDFRIEDYPKNVGLAWDRGKNRALRYSLTVWWGTNTIIENRQVLGHNCSGTENRFARPNGDLFITQKWTATDINFKYPLLTIMYGYGSRKQLLNLTIEAVANLSPVASLDPSLFEPPSGLEIEDASGLKPQGR